MATTTMPLVTSILAFIIGLTLIIQASKKEDTTTATTTLLLLAGAIGVFLSFFVNIVFT